MIKLFLISTLNISYILYLYFPKKSIQWHPFNVSTTYLTNNLQQHSSNKNKTHTVEGLPIFLESNYKLVPWLKSSRKYRYSSSFICASSGISILKKEHGQKLTPILWHFQWAALKQPWKGKKCGDQNPSQLL